MCVIVSSSSSLYDLNGGLGAHLVSLIFFGCCVNWNSFHFRQVLLFR